MVQAKPEDYPGVKPEESANDIQLFNVETDIAEMNDLAEEMPAKVEELIEEYRKFKISLTTSDIIR